jgi:putative transposase
MQNYPEKIKPNVGDAWRTDEIFVKVKGDMKCLYALMDDETRFWIAHQVADTKYTDNINPLFHKGKEATGKRPNTLISEGAPNFNDAFNKDFLLILIQKLGISVILDFKGITILSRSSLLKERSEIGKK